MATDKDRLLASLGEFLVYEKLYSKAVRDRPHIVSKDQMEFWAAFRSAFHVANLLNNMIEWDEIIILDAPATDYRDSEDVLAGIKASREKFEAWLTAHQSKADPKRQPSQIEQQTATCEIERQVSNE